MGPSASFACVNDDVFVCGAEDIDMDGDIDVFAMGSAASGVIWFEHFNNTLTFNRRSVMGPGAALCFALHHDSDLLRIST